MNPNRRFKTTRPLQGHNAGELPPTTTAKHSNQCRYSTLLAAAQFKHSSNTPTRAVQPAMLTHLPNLKLPNLYPVELCIKFHYSKFTTIPSSNSHKIPTNNYNIKPR